MNAVEILEKNEIEAEAKFYQGRAETTMDLNGDVLTSISDMLSRDKGENAQQNFVKMVAELYLVAQDLTAAHFVNTFYKLEKNNWTFKNGMGVAHTSSVDAAVLDNAADISRSTTRRYIAQEFLVDHRAVLDRKHKDLLIDDVQTSGYRFYKFN